MDRNALKLVSATIDGSVEALSVVVPRPFASEDDEPPLRILSDGTLFGLVDVKRFEGVEDIVL